MAGGVRLRGTAIDAAVVVAILSLVVSVVHATITAVIGVRRRAANRAALKSADVRASLVELRRVAGDVIALGGVDMPRFLEERLREAESTLGYLVEAVSDRPLGALCREAHERWRQVFSWAPPELGPRVWVLTETGMTDPGYEEEDRQRAERHARQVEAARAFEAAAVEVLRRLDHLERRATT